MSSEHKDFVGMVQGGRLPAHVIDGLQDTARLFEGKNVVVTIKQQRKTRSLNLNAFYWGFVVAPVTRMMREAGNYVDDEEVHEFLKREIGGLSQVIVLPDGEIKKAPGSTKKMTGSEMVLYIEKIRAWAADFGCVIAFPNEYPQPQSKGK